MNRRHILSFILAAICSTSNAQVNLDSSEFPLVGTQYFINNFAFIDVPPVSAPGPNQTYDFTNGFNFGGQFIQYNDATANPYTAEFPSATLSRYIPGVDFDQHFYYDTDANGFWQKGMAWVGYIIDTSKIDTLFFHFNAPNEDTILNNLYTYGYSDSTYALSELTIFFGVTPVDLYYHLIKKIDADGWGTMQNGFGDFDSVLRVHVTEYKYDSVFVFGNFDNAELDTAEYYLYYMEGERHPLVKEYVEPWMEVVGPDTTFYYIIEVMNVPPAPVPILGCTDSNAVNYNPLATQDDSSCVTCAPISYTITPNTFICEGSNISLNATGGTSYVWSTGDSTASITVSPSVTTTYTVLINSTQYCWEQASVQISVYDNVTAAFWAGSPTNEDTTVFVNLSTGASTYFWDFGDGNTGTEENPAHFYNLLGTYTVTLIASNLCSVDTLITTIDVMVGIIKFNEERIGLRVVPNPVQGSAQVMFTLDYMQKFDLDIIDVLGRVKSIFSERNLELGPHQIDITKHIRARPAGVYFIRLQSESGQAYFKWMKQ